MPPGPGDPVSLERRLQRADKPVRGKVISRDRGLKVGGGEHGGPGGRRRLEPQGPPPPNDVIDEFGDLAALNLVTVVSAVETHPLGDPGERRVQKTLGGLRRDAQLGRDRGQFPLAKEPEDDHEPHLR